MINIVKEERIDHHHHPIVAINLLEDIMECQHRWTLHMQHIHIHHMDILHIIHTHHHHTLLTAVPILLRHFMAMILVDILMIGNGVVRVDSVSTATSLDTLQDNVPRKEIVIEKEIENVKELEIVIEDLALGLDHAHVIVESEAEKNATTGMKSLQPHHHLQITTVDMIQMD